MSGEARPRVKHRTLLNLTHCAPAEVAAIEWALKHKHALLGVLTGAEFDGLELVQGPSMGAVWLLYRVTERIGLGQVLGRSPEGLRTLWQYLRGGLIRGRICRRCGWRGACGVWYLVRRHPRAEADLEARVETANVRSRPMPRRCY